MYSYEDRIRAVELYIKLGKRIGETIRQLGYPTKNALKGWRREYERRFDRPKSYARSTPKYSLEQKGGTVRHFPRAGLYWIQAIAPIDPTKNHAFMVEIHFVSSTWLTSTKSDGIDASLLAAYLPVQHLPRSRHPHTVAPRHLC
ncbi:transposase [Variovorax sp. KBS0712]|uniref:transposase n=1 Tax=Variovorax sp. KBS0712 TaxID=2578111 RepID=UPI0011199C19|nr:transposase [Variovorax sp. KBS0712]TSD54693.1 transposase [Variovorax sp. KBS0712]